MNKLQVAAKAIQQLITQQPVNATELRTAWHYFMPSDEVVDADTHWDFTLRIRALANSPNSRLNAFAQQSSHPKNWCEASDQECQQFLDSYQEALDISQLYPQPITANSFSIDFDTAQSNYWIQYYQHWCLLYLQSGHAELHSGTRILRFQAGDAVLLEPGAIHRLGPAADTPELNYQWVLFKATAQWRGWLNWPIAAPSIRKISVPDKQRSAVQQALDNACLHYRTPSPMQSNLLHNSVEQALLLCRDTLDEQLAPSSDPRIQVVQAYIEEHFHKDFSIEEIAAAANMSGSRLTSLFKEKTGTSVMAWRTEKRIMMAAHLLNHSSKSIGDVGAEVGYLDPAYFSRIFSRHIGCSPQQYRLKN